ncbi:DEAD/DEAH box helicase [Oceanibacterium hippocampi]|uniref:DEAD-box ATP-dependent RNA helicase RhpA n=1 Tax=Oceanibacterium hippocampi TaxID=745714 RepID=A0A1Y5U2R2_9PROT|nr:DEAD/DEAH box helicase [Oceanibacterium hippocampi]SLN77450.1 ATP-dependent RNA helicase RhlE [Oceanibacterium hippocampi]
MSFENLGLSAEVVRAVSDAGYERPTPIQEQAIPIILMGRDVLGTAQTGTGKTAGFTLPMIDILAAGRAKSRMPRSLILEPTRELAAQVAKNFETYGKYHKLSMALLIGGVSFSDQETLLDRGVDVLIATPGRLLDHFGRGGILLNGVKILVIDEADRMMDMGFIPDVEKIVSLMPPLRQTLFFSATMSPDMRKLADKFLINPKAIAVSRPESTADTVAQHLIVVDRADKRDALRTLIRNEEVKNALIFCNRKRDVDILFRSLEKHGLNAGRLHGDMNQSVRTETLASFKAGDITILVCSDVAARGIDIQGLSHVFNFDVPTHSEDYIHRIGRTGRAGQKGRAFTFATPEDGKYVAQIETLIGGPIPRHVIPEIGGEDLALESGTKRSRGRGGKSSGSAKAPASGERGSRSGLGRSKAAPAEAEAPVETVEVTQTVEATQAAEAPVEQPAAEKPVAETAAAEAPAEKRADKAPASPREASPRGGAPKRQRGGQGRNRDNEADEPVVAFGDHMPAFLARPIRTPSSS